MIFKMRTFQNIVGATIMFSIGLISAPVNAQSTTEDVRDEIRLASEAVLEQLDQSIQEVSDLQERILTNRDEQSAIRETLAQIQRTPSFERNYNDVQLLDPNDEGFVDSYLNKTNLIASDLAADRDKIAEFLDNLDSIEQTSDLSSAAHEISINAVTAATLIPNVDYDGGFSLGTTLRATLLRPTLRAHHAVGFIAKPNPTTGLYYAHCTASVIHGDVLLTAAHCFCKNELDTAEQCKRNVLDNDLTNEWVFFLPASGQYSLDEIAIHGSYKLFSANDLALVKLKQTITDVEPIELADGTVDAPVGSEITTVGYGYHNRNDDVFVPFRINWLRGTGIKIPGKFTSNECSDLELGDLGQYREKHGDPDLNDSSLICWNQGTKEKDSLFGTCKGDSGGPSYYDKKIVAVVSAGFGGEECYKKGRVNSRVSKTRKFVDKTLKTWGATNKNPVRGTRVGTRNIIYRKPSAEPYSFFFSIRQNQIDQWESDTELIVTLNGDSDHTFAMRVSNDTDDAEVCITPQDSSFLECKIKRPSAGQWLAQIETFGDSQTVDGSYQIAATLRPSP